MPDSITVAIFDFDNTMRRGDSITDLVRYAMQRGKLQPARLPGILWSTLLYLIGSKHEVEAKAQALAFMASLNEAEQEALFSGFVQDQLLPHLYPEALRETQKHADAGRKVLIVSASPDCYMRYLQPALPVAAVLATPVNAQGAVGHNCKGEEKLRRINQWAQENDYHIDWPDSYGYGDSAADAPYLRQVGHPVAVNAHHELLYLMPGIPHVTWGK